MCVICLECGKWLKKCEEYPCWNAQPKLCSECKKKCPQRKD